MTGTEGGIPGSWVTTAWPSSVGVRVWVSNIHQVEAPWPLAPAQKVTQRRHHTPEDTMIWHNNWEIGFGTKGNGENKEDDTNSLGPAGTGPPFKDGRVGGRREDKKCRGGRHPCKGEPLGADRHRWELPVLHYHKIIGIYPYHLFVAITQLFSYIIFINGCICILIGSPG